MPHMPAPLDEDDAEHGSVWYADANGNAVSTGAGTDGQVLTSAGPDAAPAWEDPAVASLPVLQDEGSPVAGAPHSTYNFTGAGVAVSNAGSGTATVTIQPPVLQDEGSPVSGAPHSTVNFVGNGVSVADAGSNVATVTIAGPPILQEEGSPVAGSPHTTINFVGSGVTVANAGSNVATVTVSATGLDGVYNVTEYGAAGDGVTDDRSAIQDAIDAADAAGGGIVYFPPGVYLCERNASNTYSLLLDGTANIELVGAGWDSVIKLGTRSASTLHLIQIQGDATNTRVADLCLDGGFPMGTSVGSTTEQCHLLRFGSGSSGTASAQSGTVSRVLFRDSRGDGVNVIGTNNGVGTGSTTTHIRVTDCTFDSCHRSGIAVQRQSWYVQIQGCMFKNTNDQDLDFEPTGNGENCCFIITGNVFDHSRKPGNTAITLTGVGAAVERHRQSVFSDNIVWEGCTNALNVANLVVTGNVFYVDTASNTLSVFQFYRGVDDVVVSNNVFVNRYRKTGYATILALDPGRECVAFKMNGGVRPRNIVFSGNQVLQESGKRAVLFESCDNVVCTDNVVAYARGDTNSRTGIGFDPSTTASEGFLCSNNIILGGESYAELRTRTQATGTLTVSANFANNETITLGATTYTFKTALTPTANEVLIGANAAESTVNLADAVTLGGGSGARYAADTVANASVWACKNLSTNDLEVVARTAGTAGNSIVSTDTCANASFGGGTLSGGTQLGDNLDLIIRARYKGSAGNSITISTVADGSGVGSWTASGTDLTFHFEDGVTTIENMIEEMRTDADVNDLINVEDTAEALGTVAATLADPGDVITTESLTGGGGTLQYGINVGGGSAAVDKITISGNQFEDCQTGDYRFNGTVSSYPIVQGNKGATGHSGLSNAVALVIGGNAANAPMLLCSGTPESQVTAPIGSTCVNVAGGAGTTFYVKESGSGNTGWAAK